MKKEPIEKIIQEALLAYQTSRIGEGLGQYASAALEKIIGDSHNAVQNRMDAVKRYEEALIAAEQGSESDKDYLKNVNALMAFMFDEVNIGGKFFQFFDGIYSFYDIFQRNLFHFCKEKHVEDWTIEGIRRIECGIERLAQYRHSSSSFREFEELEKRLNSKGKYFTSEVKEPYLNAVLLLKTTKNEELFTNPSMVSQILELENYFLNYAVHTLEQKSVVGIWNDNIINLVLQLRNAKRISGEAQNNPLLKKLDEAIEKFCNRNYPPEKVAELYSGLQRIFLDNHDKKFDDSAQQLEFFELYQSLYVYELVSGKQREPNPYLNYFELFILRQLDSFKNQSKKTNINIEKLSMRAIQSTLIKEVSRIISKEDEKVDAPLVMRYDKEIEFAEAEAVTLLDLDIIGVVRDVSTRENASIKAISVIYHEMDHYTKSKLQEAGVFSAFEDYKVFKHMFAGLRDESIGILNYGNSYHEVNAYCTGWMAILHALKQVPTTRVEDPEIVQNKNNQISKIYTHLKSTIDNKLRWYDKQDGTVKSDTDVLVIDRVYREEVAKAGGKKISPIFDFEYHDDGSPKTLAEIIRDQKRELETGELNPPCGPKDPANRAIFRFQIMMERAMAMHQEKQCYLRIKEFMEEHKEIFQDTDLFKIDFPKEKQFTSYDFDSIIEDRLKDGQKPGFQNALFLIRLNEMAKRVKFKEKFGQNLFTFCRDAFGLSEPSKTSPIILDGQDDQQPG